jgi:hypothetical protein
MSLTHFYYLLGGDSGEYTYTNVWNENILAYHVSTLIPSRPGDKQQIQRKRHIGNGMCVYHYDILYLLMFSYRYCMYCIYTGKSTI